MLYTFANAKAPDRHTKQYFEIFGNRAMYHDGWLAGTIHRAAWEFKPRRTLETDVWELYDTRSDFSLANNLAAKNPAKLKELQALFLAEATKYHVLPLDDRTLERMNAATAGRPDLMAGRTSLTVYPGMIGMSENAFINAKNRSLTITADVEIPAAGADGVVLAQAGRFGGWSLYLLDGKPTYTYNWLGLHEYTVASTQALPAGKAAIKLDFTYDGGGVGKGGTATIFANGANVATGRIEQTQGMVFSADEAADVGEDEGTAVSQG
jgi:arylsulfatase